MCGRKLRKLLVILVLLLQVSLLPCFADVTLTDEEAQELLLEIQKSKNYSSNVMENSMILQEQLEQYEKMQNELQAMRNEQNQFYKTQYIEAQKSKRGAYITAGAILILILLILLV